MKRRAKAQARPFVPSRRDHNLPSHQVGSLTHASKAEPHDNAQVRHIEADAVVIDRQKQLAVTGGERNMDAAGTGVTLTS